MPKPVNTKLRIAIPIITGLFAIGVAWSVWKVGQPKPATAAPAVTTPEQKPAEQPAPKSPETAAQTTPAATPAPAPAAAPAAGATLSGLTAQVFTGDPLATFDGTIGGLEKKGPETAQLRFSPLGAGLNSADLANYFLTIQEKDHLALQVEHRNASGDNVLTPMAALAIEIIQPGAAGQPAQPGQVVGLVGGPGAPVWRRVNAAPGAFEAFIVDGAGAKVLRITRTYTLAPGSRDVRLEQTIDNLTATPLSVRWYQVGAVDPPGDSGTYGGDKRFVRFGYLLPPDRDPTQAAVLSDTFDKARTSLIGERFVETAADGTTYTTFRDWTIWPTPAITENKIQACWIAYTNRYFGVAVHSLFDPAKAGGRAIAWLGSVDRIVLDGGVGQEVLGLRLTSLPMNLGAAGTLASRADLSHGVYVGPLEKKLIKSDPLLKSLRLDHMVVYNFGGPCGFCTFDTITSLLLGILRFLHDNLFHDWALAIVFLVVIVRSCLHPLTRWTQIRMAVFGKQMSGIGPKQKLIQERYKDDPAKMQQETAKLWREEGISPAGFLGCLPAFAQTPVWIALSAVLFFAVELRHQPAFYGIFQSAQQQGWITWWFLGDLAEPDALIHFGRTVVTLPILGPITSINLLPLILGIVFFIQQKYLQPPTTTQMTPEQEMQAKMMKWMTVFMFPIMMYNAPAGLALYFTVNSTLTIIESKYIRAHMEEKGLLDLDKIKAKREARRQARGGGGAAGAGSRSPNGGDKPGGGFMAALQSYAQKQQQETQRSFGQDKPKKK